MVRRLKSNLLDYVPILPVEMGLTFQYSNRFLSKPLEYQFEVRDTIRRVSEICDYTFISESEIPIQAPRIWMELFNRWLESL